MYRLLYRLQATDHRLQLLRETESVLLFHWVYDCGSVTTGTSYWLDVHRILLENNTTHCLNRYPVTKENVWHVDHYGGYCHSPEDYNLECRVLMPLPLAPRT